MPDIQVHALVDDLYIVEEPTGPLIDRIWMGPDYESELDIVGLGNPRERRQSKVASDPSTVGWGCKYGNW